MTAYLVKLDNVSSVREWSVTIYHHLTARTMLLTTDEQQLWPLEALETFRLWVNQGWRIDRNSSFDRANRLSPPKLPDPVLRIRPDIRALSEAELNMYRARLDDVMQTGHLDTVTPWQKYSNIHTNWCFSHQEASVLWHRAYLLYLEELIDHPIPYWDWMAENADTDGNPEAGLPQAFIDETYIHPGTGEKRLNPLRYAAATADNAKPCVSGQTDTPDCRYVQRNPLFYTVGPDHRAERSALYATTRIFQQKIIDALKLDTFSIPQNTLEYPWVNIPAVDPLFCSFHANLDRMLEVWMRAHPAVKFTTQTLLQPFLGAGAKSIHFTTSAHWRYTSIGEMAQDSRRIGYDYGKPVARQFKGANNHKPFAAKSAPLPSTDLSGLRHLHLRTTDMAEGPWVVFDDVGRSHDHYHIDVFINQPDARPSDANSCNMHYVGRLKRTGTGPVDDKKQYLPTGVSHRLDATNVIRALNLALTDSPTVSILVTEIDSGRLLSVEEYATRPGFVPQLIWDEPPQPMTENMAHPLSCSMH
ncbi:tyrosinase [Thalassospira profundimaris]|uniref:Tyrosinase n=1 Tax=Thalassospira profundimaris TaxID=502049 RepID=A0A367XC63_9PROT|nr:tyrosinase family protein [Thalassospira profundimaris]RCK50361.1 tyrosinase [Thalassospira profundimaris]